MAEIPTSRRDLRDRDPEVRKERVKLVVNGLNAVGLALLIGATVAPVLDPSRFMAFGRSVVATAIGFCLILAAIWLMRYIKRLET